MYQKYYDVNELNRKYRSTAFYYRVLPLDPCLDDVGGTTDAGSYADCRSRTVCRTGPAFHAGIPINNNCFGVPHVKNCMGTDYFTHAAAGALFNIKLQGGHIIEVSEILHQSFLSIF
jgi:hypothetical protein